MKPKQERRALQSLYDLIPVADIPCVEGCSDCCGPVNLTREELKRAPLIAGSLEQLESFVSQGIANWCATCPYVVEHGGGCAIYDGRPLLCRLFGVTDEPMLKCPHGPRSTRPLSQTNTSHLMSKYFQLFDEQGRRDLMRTKQLWAQKREQERSPRTYKDVIL